jgi:hypothetical protein
MTMVGRDDHVSCSLGLDCCSLRKRARARTIGSDQVTLASFCRQRTTAGMGVSGKLLGQLVTPTSPT